MTKAARRRVVGALIALTLGLAACSSVEVVRIQPDILRTPRGTEPLAGLQVTCMGFYFFTLGIPEADLDKAINDLLAKEAKKLGADKLIDLRFDATPSGGIWWLTKLLWFRLATAWAIAIVAEPADVEPPRPAPASSPTTQRGRPASRPATPVF